MIESFLELWQDAVGIWGSGGWAMYPIGLISFFMFAIGLQVAFRLRDRRFSSVGETTWRRWVNHPRERHGRVGRLIEHVTSGRTAEDMRERFTEVLQREGGPFERDLKLMKVCVSAAPLVGLLGTVTGMLATFDALARGSGGDKTMAQIAGGISEALVTTMTGLVVALPGVFFQYQLERGFARYRSFLTHMESVCMQARHGHIIEEHEEVVRELAQKAIASQLQQASN